MPQEDKNKSVPSYSQSELGSVKPENKTREQIRKVIEQNKGEAVFGGEFIPRKVAQELAKEFKDFHQRTNHEHSCEALYVCAFATFMKAMGMPGFIAVDVTNEFAKILGLPLVDGFNNQE